MESHTIYKVPILLPSAQPWSLNQEITNAQRLNEIKNNLVANILENIQNLYFVAKLDDMNEINKEFIRLWNGDDMEALKEFNEKLNIMAEMYRV